MPHLSRTRLLATALLTVSALTACGTTVKNAGSLAGGSDSGLGDGSGSSTSTSTTGGTPDALSSAGDGGGATGTTSGTVASTTGGSALGTSGTSGAGGSTGGGAGGSTGSSPLKSKKDIGVLFFYVNGGNKVLSSVFPGSSASFGDGQGEAKAVIADINAHGGVNGRHLVPDFVPIEATAADDNSVGTACDGAVQDKKPLAILSIFNISRPLVACAKKNHVLLIDVALGAGDDGVYKGAPDLAFSPTQISRDLEARLVLSVAHKNGTLTPKTPVGVLYETDDPQFGNVVTNTVQPLLKSWGVPAIIATISNGADTSGLSSAGLQFRSNGVKYVTFSLGAGGIPEVLFMQNANQQGYTPNYLMGDSTDTSFVQSAAPQAQVRNISGSGTYPLANVAAGDYPSSPGEVHCLSVLNKSLGGYKNRGTSLTGTLACELLYGFTFIAKRAVGNLSVSSFDQAYRAIGKSYPALTTFQSDLTAARNDNASLFRTFSYQAACQCIKYTSGNQSIAAATS